MENSYLKDYLNCNGNPPPVHKTGGFAGINQFKTYKMKKENYPVDISAWNRKALKRRRMNNLIKFGKNMLFIIFIIILIGILFGTFACLDYLIPIHHVQ